MWATASVLGIFMLGWIAGHLVTRTTRERLYSNPNLHSGKWDHAEVIGVRDQTRVRWVRQTAPRQLFGGRHTHRPAVCNIGPGMAHLDECVCGATRSGVYGEWLP